MTDAPELTPEQARIELERLGPISPELVLVSPDLGEVARRALTGPDGAPAPAVRPEQLVRRPLRGVRLPRTPAALVAAGAAGFVLGAVAIGLWTSGNRQPAPVAEPAGRADADAAVLRSSRPPASRSAGPKLKELAPRAAHATPTRTQSGARRRPRRRPLVPIGPPRSGYIFGVRGRFALSATGRAVVGFSPDTRCGQLFTLPAMRIGRDGRFGFAGAPPGTDDKSRFQLHGLFVRPTVVRGTMRLRTNHCDTGVMRFTARLS